jgi:hypothetical protein
MTDNKEFWLSGAIDDVPALLQPVAHALLQARWEAHAATRGFPQTGLWVKPDDLASVGFHLQHMSGVIDRLFTYARGEALTKTQLTSLREEAQNEASLEVLLLRLDEQVEAAIAQLRRTDPATLTDARGVGRAQLPSTVMGLLFHAAEHTMRHTGQLRVTARWVTTTFA